MLVIGNDKGTIEAASKAIVDVLKVANDVSSVAAMQALIELARAPQHTNVSNCVFTSDPKKRKRK